MYGKRIMQIRHAIEMAEAVISDHPDAINSLDGYDFAVCKALLLEINSLRKTNGDLAEAIHYPGCWDTAAFPELADALKEVGCNPADCER